MDYEKERAAVIAACKQMQALDYFLGTWGNVSLRVNDYILLTPSRVDYSTMLPEDLVVIDLDGCKISGKANPTSEKEVHRQIYKKRKDIGGIIHCHSVYATAVCASADCIQPIFEEMSQLLGGSIPVTSKYIPAEQHQLLGIEAANALSDRNAVLLRNHGPVCCGRDLDEAILVSRVVEKACKIYLAVRRDLALFEIEEPYVVSERFRYLYKYGKENA